MEIPDGGMRAGELPIEIEDLVKRVERASNYYEALGLAPSADLEDVKLAYRKAMTLLTPSRVSIGLASPGPDHSFDVALAGDQLARIDSAFDGVVLAFSTLANPSKRVEYDKYALVKSIATPPDEKGVAIFNDASIQAAEENRRRSERFELSVEMEVVGHSKKAGRWQECAETCDVSRTGLTCRMRRRVRHGSILHLTLPMPQRLRSHALKAARYSVYGLVRRIEPSKKGLREVGVEFIGEHPPLGYLDKPWSVFQSKKWIGSDRRRRPRKSVVEVVWVEYFNESMQPIRQESGRTENVSKGGMRLSVKLAPADFELVRVSYPDRGVETFASVCNRYLGKDGVERLCLKYMDNTELAGRAGNKKGVEKTDAANRPVVEKHGAEMAGAKSPAANPNAGPKKILVADDDAPLRKVLGKILVTAGYEVILVGDGNDAVDKARTEKPDLVITDGLMPKMHGFMVCKAIKELPSPPRVIMLTAVYTKLQYKWEAKEKYGADDLVTKPFEVAELLTCIEKHLAARLPAPPH